ncbi:MAG: tripartite tricarboxylate transporter substrate binding protein [Burkholderiaceae bacterium]
MTHDRRTFVKAAAATGALGLLPTIGRAQAKYPSRPIRYICPWTAGGSTDIVMRSIAESASKTIGQNVLIDNKPGAGGTLGAVEVARSKPDGYTLTQLPVSVFRIPHMQRVQFNTLTDFTWIACLTGYTFGMVVPANSPIKSIQELVAYAKANPGKFTYGSPGIATSPHLAVEEFCTHAGIEMQHVPFKGNAEGLQAVLGGHIMGLSDSTGWGPYVDEGKLRLLATYGSQRTKHWPNVPTLTELGYKTVSESPYGICGPKNMAPELVKTIHDAFKQTLSDPKVLQTLERYDQTVNYMSTEQYTKYAMETFEAERKTMDRLGLTVKT